MKRIFIILFAAALLSGCNDDDTDSGSTAAEISVSAGAVTFQVGGEAVDDANAITVTSSGEWRLKGKKTWCTPSAVQGKSGEKVTFTAQANTTTEPRSITYTFICGDKTQDVVVTQKQSAVMDFLSQTEFDVESTAGLITIRLTANSDLTLTVAEDSKDWIDVPVTRTETQFITIKYTANDTYSDRTGTVVFKVDGKEAAVTIRQVQNDAVIPQKTEYEVASTGGALTIDLQTNLEHEVYIASAYSWITIAPQTLALGPKQVVLNIEEATATRVGKVVFRSQSGDDLSSISIIQRAGTPIYVDVPDDNFKKLLIQLGYVVASADGTKCEVTENGTAATTISAGTQQIKSLEGIGAFPALKSISCQSNYITKLDLSKNHALTSLSVSNNPLEEVIISDQSTMTSLNLSRYLRNPDGVYSKKLKVSAAKVTSLNVSNNQLESIDMAGCVALKTITCNNNAFTSIDVSKCPAMTNFNCSTNALTSLDVSQNVNMTSLVCNTNNLSALDVSNNLKLNVLNCKENPKLVELFLKTDQTINTLNKDEQTLISYK